MFYIYPSCGSRLFTKNLRNHQNMSRVRVWSWSVRVWVKQNSKIIHFFGAFSKPELIFCTGRVHKAKTFWSKFQKKFQKLFLNFYSLEKSAQGAIRLNPKSTNGRQNPIANILFSKQRISLLIRMGVFGRLFFLNDKNFWPLSNRLGRNW